MSLYPSFEGLTVGKEVEAQNQLATAVAAGVCKKSTYGELAMQFLGIDISNIVYDTYGNASLPALCEAGTIATSVSSAIVPTTNRRNPIEVSQAVKEINLCKNVKGYVGLQLRNEDQGVFISYIESSSPAALAGLRFGDQVLQINGHLVAGFTGKKAMKLISKGPRDGIKIVIRDRPLERCITLHKDSRGHVGVLIRDGQVASVVEDSSAARNGVLTHHHVVEVNGVNVLGLPDHKIQELLRTSGEVVMFTVIPSFFFHHLTKRLCRGHFKSMDRSMPMA